MRIPGTLGPLAYLDQRTLISKNETKEPLLGSAGCDRVTAKPPRLQIELVDKDKDTLDACADGPDRHGSSGDIDDVLVNADRVRHGLAFVLRVEPFFADFASLRLAKDQKLHVRATSLTINTDHIGHMTMLPDRIMDQRVAVHLVAGFTDVHLE